MKRHCLFPFSQLKINVTGGHLFQGTQNRLRVAPFFSISFLICFISSRFFGYVFMIIMMRGFDLQYVCANGRYHKQELCNPLRIRHNDCTCDEMF